MDPFEWILLIESHVGRRGSTRLVRPFCKRRGDLLQPPFKLVSPYRTEKETSQPPIAFYSLSPSRWLRDEFSQ